MHKLVNAVRNFLRDEDGLTMTEYAVAGSLVTLGAVTAFTTLGGNISTAITAIAGYITVP